MNATFFCRLGFYNIKAYILGIILTISDFSVHFQCLCFGIKKDSSLGWSSSVDWVLAYEPKGQWFDSQSGHMPGLWARSSVAGMWEATAHWYFSSFLSSSLCHSKNKQTNKQIWAGGAHLKCVKVSTPNQSRTTFCWFYQKVINQILMLLESGSACFCLGFCPSWNLDCAAQAHQRSKLNSNCCPLVVDWIIKHEFILFFSWCVRHGNQHFIYLFLFLNGINFNVFLLLFK